MRTINRKSKRPALRTACAIGAAVSLSVISGTAGAADGSSALEEVIVTASKREQSLIEVPQSIVALDERLMSALSVNDVQDYAHLVPGLIITAPTPGVAKTTIRGLSSESVTSSVGVYINETPVTQNELDPDLKLFDVQRIEVLRGPQGTLYGEGSLGGTVRIITKAPDTSAFAARVETGVSSYKNADDENYYINAMLNAPVSDKLAVRAVAGYRSNGAWIDNLGPGDTENDERALTGRIAAKLQATDAFAITATYIYQDIELGDSRNITDPALGDLQRFTRVDSSGEDRLDLGSITLDWDIGPATLIWDNSWYEREQRTIGNNNETGGVQFFYSEINGTVAGFPPFAQFSAPPGFPYLTVAESVVDFSGTAEQYTSELRLVSKADASRIDWIVGAFYKDRRDTKYTDFWGLIEGEQPLIDLDAAGVLKGGTLIRHDYEQIALFGEVTFNITPTLDLIAGLRWASEKITNLERLTGVFRYDFGSNPPTTTPEQFGPISDRFDAVTPRVVLSWQPVEGWTLYGSVSKGFRSGGFVGVTPFDPDEVINYEVGAKGRFADGRASLASAVYYIDWKDTQAFDDIPDPPFFAVLNIGDVEVRGLELEASFMPIDGLEIALGGAYTDTEVVRVSENATANVGLIKGNRMQKVPEYTLHAVTTYRWPIFGRYMASVSANALKVDSSYSDFRNLPEEKVPGYTTFGLRAGVENDNWGVFLIGKNLTDERVVLDISVPPSPVVGVQVARPRLLGLEFRMSFE